MQESKPFYTPMSPNTRINVDEKETSKDPTLYKGIIGSLLYVAASRPYIM